MESGIGRLSKEKRRPNLRLVIESLLMGHQATRSPLEWPFVSMIGVEVSSAGGTPNFFVKSFGCNGDTPGTLWRFQGTAPGGTWQQVPPPGGGGSFASIP